MKLLTKLLLYKQPLQEPNPATAVSCFQGLRWKSINILLWRKII